MIRVHHVAGAVEMEIETEITMGATMPTGRVRYSALLKQYVIQNVAPNIA